MNTDALMELSNRYLINTYNRFPVVIVKGKGSRVWDVEGREYLDFVAGLAVCNLGHCHPAVVKAVQEQASELLHISNLYYIKPQIELAKLLCENSFADRVFFCNSGAEANEAAIKLARKYFRGRGENNRYRIITATNSFHGRTMATLSATGQEKFHKGFEPLLNGFDFVPFDNIDALEMVADSRTAAIMLEPIQGEGGVNLPGDDYLKEVRNLCDKMDILLILDEVQTGMGRTGKLFAQEHYGITPDIMTLAKGLGGGLPIGAMLAKEEVASAFISGSHASTFGGNPLVARAGLAVLEVLLQDEIVKNTEEVGLYLIERLEEVKGKFPFIKEVRGKGLMVGMELEISGGDIVKKCLEEGLLLNCTCEKTLRFLPPLIVTQNEVNEMIDILETVLEGVRV